MERNRKFQPYRNETNEKKESDDEESVRDTQFKNPCRKHNKQHEWEDCPDNPANKSRTERGEVSSVETSEKKKSSVRFKP